MRTLSAVGFIALVLVGCASSPPMRFYTLAPVAASDSPATATTTNGIRVTRVRIPGELNRNEIVQRIDATRVDIVEQDRWAAPLDEMIRRVLTANLAARAPDITGNPTLTVDIDEFIGDSTCAVTLRASWDLKGPGPTDASHGSELIRVPATGACSVSALPAQMSAALATLTDKILAARH